MNHDEVIGRMNDFLDGALSSRETREMEAHLSRCSSCQKELHRLGSLLDMAIALRDRPVEPARDLWPGIRERISPAASNSQAAGHRAGAGMRRILHGFSAGWKRPPTSRRPLFVPLAWSGALAVIGVCVLTTLYSQHTPESPGAFLTGLSVAESSATEAKEDLRGALKEHSVQLPPEVGGEFERNLALLDQALKDSRAALEQDPENKGLQRSLLKVYQQQLRLVRWATRLARESGMGAA